MIENCDARGFLIEGTDIRLCPQACLRVGEDPNAELDTLFGCELEIR